MDQRRKCWRYMRRLHRRIHLPEIEYIESRNTVGSLSSSVKGKASPLESKAATESINLLFPSPGSPCNSVTLPKGIYGYHSHFTLMNCYTKIFTVLSKKSLTTSEIFANI